MKHYGDIISKTLIKAPRTDKLSEFFEVLEESQKKTREIMQEGFGEWQDVLFPQGLSVEEAVFRIYTIRRLASDFRDALEKSDELAADTAESFTRLIVDIGKGIKIGFSITPTPHEGVESKATREEDDNAD